MKLNILFVFMLKSFHLAEITLLTKKQQQQQQNIKQNYFSEAALS
jgi:hypothetical protein